MVDSRLSNAVVVYIWGEPRTLPYPSEHPEDVARVCGDDAPELVAHIKAILAEAYAEPMVLPGEWELRESAHRIESVIRSRHPELDNGALQAIGTHVAFNTR